MSVTKCKACKQQIGKNAEVCPNCGEPQKRKSVGCLGAIGIVIVVLVLAGIIAQEIVPTPSQPKPSKTVDVDCSLQADRGQFIQKMINDGYWEKVHRPAKLTRIDVMPLFMASATKADKEKFVSVVSAWDRCEGGDGLITLIDAMTGNEVGSYGDYGLKLK